MTEPTKAHPADRCEICGKALELSPGRLVWCKLIDGKQHVNFWCAEFEKQEEKK